MNQIRWGLCCQFRDTPIKYRSTTVTYIERLKANKQDYLNFLDKIILDNLNALSDSINYCSEHNIGSFRIMSQFLPIYCHIQHGYQLEKMPSAIEIFKQFSKCKKLAKEKKIRLSYHPDQFVVLNSTDQHVVQQSLRELEYHGEMAQLLGADVINIHVGGVYRDKPTALKRFAQNFEQLSQNVKERLTIENDDKSYTPEDLLPLCHKLNIPLVYDVHHHRCLPDQLTIECASDLAYSTWNREPLFHLSSPLEGWQGNKPQRHHDFINLKDFPLYWLKFPMLTVEIEAKAKEVAILKLMQELKTYLEAQSKNEA
jgi:UV DNA damage endonuclease